MSTSFVRAFSPMAGVLAATSQSSPESYALARTHTIAAAASVEDVIACVPLAFQGDLAIALRDVASVARKRCATRNTLAKYQALEAKGQVPSSIRQKEPSIQMTKEFAETEAGKALVAKVVADHKAYIDGLFKQLVAAKTAELQELSALLVPEKVCDSSFSTNSR